MKKLDLKNMTLEGLEQYIVLLGEGKYRAKQVYTWLFKGVDSFDDMTNISKGLRKKLEEHSYISKAVIEKKMVSEVDGTIKYLMKLEDGEFVECVIMHYKHGVSICISSQVGCNMGCTFCASALGGKTRDLSSAEMINQIITAQNDIGERISNVVIMGMGEPLDNYDNVIKFLKNVNNENSLNIGYRHITLSTCGLIEKMDKLATENMPITLSVSLHAPNDTIRAKLMPISKKYSVSQVIDACRRYADDTRRRVSIEYSMINGVNDSPACAKELAMLLRGMLCHVNLIPVNKISEDGYERSNDKSIQNFSLELQKHSITVTIRRKLGSDINASCGQLRKNIIDSKK